MLLDVNVWELKVPVTVLGIESTKWIVFGILYFDSFFSQNEMSSCSERIELFRTTTATILDPHFSSFSLKTATSLTFLWVEMIV